MQIREMRNWLSRITAVIPTLLVQVPMFVIAMYFRWAGLLVWLTGVLFTIRLLSDLTADTTAITNGGFALVASLAALSFAACRSIPEPASHQDRLRYAGERLMHGAVVLLYASILKYAAFAFNAGVIYQPPAALKARVISVAGVLSGFAFGLATQATYRGVSALNQVLWMRFGRAVKSDDLEHEPKTA